MGRRGIQWVQVELGAPVGHPSARKRIWSPKRIRVGQKTKDKGVSLTVE